MPVQECQKAATQGRAIKVASLRRDVANPLALERIKAGREALKGAGKRLPAVKPTPQPQPPRLIEASYAVRMNRLLAPYYKVVREQLIPAIGPIKRRFEEEMKTDTYNDDLVEVFESIDTELRVGQAETLASNVANEAQLFNKVQVDKQLRSVTGIDVLRSEPWLAPSTDAFVQGNVALIKSVPTESKRRIETLVRTKVEAGESTRKIQEGIRKELGIAQRRAKLIARDQVSKFNGKLSKLRQEESGVDSYIWSTSLDERVRDSHQVLNGTVQKWNKAPAPGHPGEDVQCRCVAVAVIPGLTDIPQTQARQIGKARPVFCFQSALRGDSRLDAGKVPGKDCIAGKPPKLTGEQKEEFRLLEGDVKSTREQLARQKSASLTGLGKEAIREHNRFIKELERLQVKQVARLEKF